MRFTWEKAGFAALGFAAGILGGAALEHERAEASVFKKIGANVGIIEDLKATGRAIKQMDADIRSLQKQVEDVREARMSMAKRLGIADAIREDDERENEKPSAKP